mmetsp:Transcript_13425/g.32803  ORF Transcript_13425/g.32803 Transcript_13425/m.32803 type:complete len:805 (-) Transcript_13425:652-3066(-)|eukprot:CAMPEP_0202866824 /NCGR_PEP_ID=MMETSP1391-20130828/8380_1 /ASSEMBLY_ACC=CAM_ASM_000867 /TAXON_ID=1034604 /ORGANISM="Chlamydomonas leiostraca, Strain SAG 11-49" /LENGTH=804 /DNA_ID=CAMNT_0049546809 /DNA_START=108 /DNA_END=2522 /DNA_ORIENTATION=-
MRTAITVGSAVAAGLAAGFAGYKIYKDSYAAAPPDEVVAAALKGNEKLFHAKEVALIRALLDEGQAHLFADWPAPGTEDASKKKMVAQLVSLDTHYHGGLCAYIANAKQLLRDSKEGRNPFDGYTPSVPHGERLDFASPGFLELEQAGLAEAGSSAFVLVAGGLGERLGYSGIKVALPCESATGTTFLELYCRYILALQARSGAKKPLPLAIMTSDDTHARTVALLEKHSYFGMAKGQVTLIKQEKVACLTDNDAHLAIDPADKWAVQTKPHGHGDVHALLHSSGLARRWHKEGLKWVCFFQDTNALVFRALTAALGVSARHGYDMNSLAVPRRAKEAIGAIAALKHKDGSTLTINVEYNQLDPLLRATTHPNGDSNDSTGFSPFPGNINQLVVKLDSYVQQLARTGGVISEFVNPKYKDASKTAFKSSTRLECMMQDYPKALPPGSSVGFTTVNQVWASYSPVKNSPADAAAKAKEGNPTHSATAGEADIYKAHCETLKALAGAKLPAKLEGGTFNAIPTELYPRVVLSPEFAPVLADVQAKVAPGSISLAPSAALVLDGRDIRVEGPLEVAGALVVRAVPGAKVTVGALKVANAGWVWFPLKDSDPAPEEERIRGFKVVRKETAEYIFDKPGTYTVGQVKAPAAAAAAAPPAPAAPAKPAAAAAAAAPKSVSVPAPAAKLPVDPAVQKAVADIFTRVVANASKAPAPAAAAKPATPAAPAAPKAAPAAPAAPAAAKPAPAAAAAPAAAKPAAAAAAAAPANGAADGEEEGDEEGEEEKPAAAGGAAPSSGAAKKKKKKKSKK